MLDIDALYYRSRAEAEAQLADQAKHPKAIAAHNELASSYSARAQIASTEKTKDGV